MIRNGIRYVAEIMVQFQRSIKILGLAAENYVADYLSVGIDLGNPFGGAYLGLFKKVSP